MPAKEKGLGKGFDSLFPKTHSNIIGVKGGIQEVPLDKIDSNPEQPRKKFSLQELEELSKSIQNKGVLQPILLQKKNNRYEIIAGERRWRASKIAGLKKIKAIFYDIPDKEVRELALIENVQRSDLNPIEEASAYHSLLEQNSFTQEELAKRIGKNRATIANLLRLLSLPKSIIDKIIENKISVGHAKCLLSLDNLQEQEEFAKLVLQNKLSVRALELAIKNKGEKKRGTKPPQKIFYKAEQETLMDFLQTGVEIQQGKNAGTLSIQFFNKQDLERIIKKIME